MNRYPRVAIAVLSVAAASYAQAVPVTLTLSAVGFRSFAPVQSFSGIFTYEAASITSTISSMTSVSMSIAGHAYTLGEIAYQSPWGGSGSYDMIYGVLNATGVSGGTDDFYLYFDRLTGAVGGVTYTSHGSTSVYDGFASITRTTNTGTPVPEPATLALVGAALAGVTATRRRRPVAPRS